MRREVEEEGEVDEYKRMELPVKYTAKLLYGWEDRKFEEEYLSKLEKNWKRWKEDRKINESEHLERVEEQKKEKGKPMEIERVEEWEVKKILNKRKIREVDKYLIR